MSLISIRGAITVPSNSKNEIIEATKELLRKIEIENNLEKYKVINITFTATKDLTKVYPAVAARQLGYLNTALMCLQEMFVENSLKKCIRVNILYETEVDQSKAVHIYLRDAKKLRPDLGGNMDNLDIITIAVDGPASSGKSTVAKNLAKELSITYIDTGAMYRAITYKVYSLGIDINNLEEINSLLDNTTIDFLDGSILLDGKIVDSEIRENYISQRVSNVAKIKEVREKLVKIQREMSKNKSIVMDGRDIGSVVLPDADFKFFVTANVEERARRRYRELLEKGEDNISINQIEDEIRTRDKIDSTRKIAPLIKSPGAYEIDNSNLMPSETLAKVVEIVKRGKNVI